MRWLQPCESAYARRDRLDRKIKLMSVVAQASTGQRHRGHRISSFHAGKAALELRNRGTCKPAAQVFALQRWSGDLQQGWPSANANGYGPSLSTSDPPIAAHRDLFMGFCGSFATKHTISLLEVRKIFLKCRTRVASAKHLCCSSLWDG